VAVKIKLMRLGKMRAPYYRIVVADARTKREGRVIETIGKYHPKEDPSFIEVDGERAAYWLGVGAQPTEPVAAILKVTGDWQKFKGLPAPPPMLVAEPKPDRKAIFEAAARESGGETGGAATTPKKKAAPKAAAGKTADDDTAPAGHAAPPADQPATATPAVAEGESPAPAADGPAAETPAAEPTAPEAGTGSTQEAGGAADASAAAIAADDATSPEA
jgi:small subunit ribosomal protein S16